MFHLHGFSRLRSLRFAFHPKFTEVCFLNDVYTPSPSFSVQKAILASLCSNPPLSGIKSLSLLNLVGADDGMYEMPAFQAIIASLQSLAISTISQDTSYGSELTLREWNQHFWFYTVSDLFLKPAEANLTSLSLDSDEYVGPLNAFDIDKFYFPNLISLKLGRFVFGWHEPDVFIVKHKLTLETLELRECGMYWGDDSVQKWHDVWDTFRTELARLKEIRISIPNPYRSLRSLRRYPNLVPEALVGKQHYIRLDDEWGFNTLYDFWTDETELEDEKAWDSLREVVDLRRSQGARSLDT